MNATTQALYDLVLYSSDSTMFPEDKVWESLIEQGKAEDFYW
jgi:hypothetical protein